MKDYAILFRFTPGELPCDDILEILDAPYEVWVDNRVVEHARPDLLAIGDGIWTFAPRDVSRVSYREVRYERTTNLHILERIA